MKKYFSYDAYCNDVHFFDTLEEAKQHHIGNCEEFYDYFADSGGSAEHYVDGLESGFYGEVRGYSTCERRKPTQAECDEVDRDFEVYVEPPVLTESVSAWIPCSERMPEQSGYYLVSVMDISSQDVYQSVSYCIAGCRFSSSFNERVTHWMPLPTPPQD
ncbi:hypothetical protein ADP71_40520 [Vitreoscilla sp. C1]|uniref:DUF551 domain-containing protein n=1 Tax=Vitreoscilla sp. (strain C1) TaxID=96942 RepID=UPI00148EBBAC|nr:DUF551 domain-containing protein [Vitreoscilla sp. C1]QJQ52283.1 hypothetical protein ADP71_40520 [Vitreoscilla sp. C1]